MLGLLKLKKVWIPLLVVVAIVGLAAYTHTKNAQPPYTTELAKRQDLQQTVSVTGTVKAAEQVDVNFKSSGRLLSLPVTVGDKVRLGQLLAALDSRDVQAAVLTAQAQLKQAQAALAKLRAGASSEDVAVAQAAVDAAQTTLDNTRQSLDNTKASQTQAVANAWAQLVGLPAQALPTKGNLSTGSLTVSGTYTGSEAGTYTIRLENQGNLTYSVYGLETFVTVDGSRTTTASLGRRGLQLQLSASGTFVTGDTWTVEIPNTSSSSYASLRAAYEAALAAQKQQVQAAEASVRAAEQSLAQAQAQLALKTAAPRSYDLDSAEAQVESARAGLLKAQSDLADRTAVAPVPATVTQVNYQVGETTSATTPVVVLLADGRYEIKAQVPEADVAKLAVGQLAKVSLDAFGSGEHFAGHVSFVDPASTVIQDVVYYEVTVLFDNADSRLKPGMTANVDVLTASRQQVVVVPLPAVKYQADHHPYVEVPQGRQLVRQTVTLGLRGDDGLVEVTDGLAEGTPIVTYKSNGKK